MEPRSKVTAQTSPTRISGRLARGRQYRRRSAFRCLGTVERPSGTRPSSRPEGPSWMGGGGLPSEEPGLALEFKGCSWVSDDVTSPCIDAGDPASALLGEPLTSPIDSTAAVVNTRIDMGPTAERWKPAWRRRIRRPSVSVCEAPDDGCICEVASSRPLFGLGDATWRFGPVRRVFLEVRLRPEQTVRIARFGGASLQAAVVRRISCGSCAPRRGIVPA